MQKVLYVSCENNKRLEQAFKIVYNPTMKISISEEVEKIAKYTQFKWKSEGERELVKAYLSETEEEYYKQMKELKEKYVSNEIGLLLIKEFEKKTEKDIKAIPKVIRHLICSYSIKRKTLNLAVRTTKEYEKIKDVQDFFEKQKEYFSTFEKTRMYSKKDWTEILNQIYKEKYEEIKEYV